jgi:hypothetical protein
MPVQEPLWHDTPEDAVRSLVDALGGPKKVGAELWPVLPVADAGRRVTHCLDAERPEKLTLGELSFLLKWGREKGVHVAATFFMESAGYRKPEPLAPADERAELQRQFMAAVSIQADLVKRMERLGGVGG